MFNSIRHISYKIAQNFISNRCFADRKYITDLEKQNFFRSVYFDKTNKLLVNLAKKEDYIAMINYLLAQDLGRVKKMEFFEDEMMEGRFSSRYLFEYIKNEFSPPKKILDLANGGAFLSYNIAHLEHYVSCVDISVPKILSYPHKHPEKKVNDKISFYFALCENLPFADEYFDIIYSQETLEHVIHLGKVISEMYRVLKPGGTLILQVPYEKTCDSTNHLRIFCLDDIKRIFPLKYFEILEIKKIKYLDNDESYTFNAIFKKNKVEEN